MVRPTYGDSYWIQAIVADPENHIQSSEMNICKPFELERHYYDKGVK